MRYFKHNIHRGIEDVVHFHFRDRICAPRDKGFRAIYLHYVDVVISEKFSQSRQSMQLDQSCSKLVSTALGHKYYCFPHQISAETPYFPTFPAGLAYEYC